MNQSFKDLNVRSMGMLTHVITSNPETRVIQNNSHGFLPLSNSRSITTNIVSGHRQQQSLGAFNQARFITSEWRGDTSKVWETKHSPHSLIDQAYEKNSADRLSGV
jgi:hypothetical protein